MGYFPSSLEPDAVQSDTVRVSRTPGTVEEATPEGGSCSVLRSLVRLLPPGAASAVGSARRIFAPDSISVRTNIRVLLAEVPPATDI